MLDHSPPTQAGLASALLTPDNPANPVASLPTSSAPTFATKPGHGLARQRILEQ